MNSDCAQTWQRLRQVFSVSLLICVAAGLAPAATGERVEVEIPIFVGGFGIAFFEETARRYEAMHPGVRIHLYGDARIANKLRVRVLGGEFPDATDAELPWRDLIRAGKVADLRPYLESPNWEGDQSWKDSFLPGSLDPWTMADDGIYAVPFTRAIFSIYYNKALFRQHGWEIPVTWDEFFALCEEIRAAGISPVALPGVYARYADHYLRGAFHSLAGPEGYRAFANFEPGVFEDPRFIRAAEVVQRLARHYLQPGWEGMSHTAAQLEFFQGNAAMVSTGSWLTSEMRGKIPDNFELGTFNYPAFEAGAPTADHVLTGGGYYFVFADSPHREEAVNFLRFLTSRERSRAFAADHEGISSTRGIDPALFPENMQDAVRLLLESGGSYTAPQIQAEFPRMNQALTDLRWALLTGRISPETFGSELERTASAVRSAAADPSHLDIRFPFRGALLLLFLLGVPLLWLWKTRRRRANATARLDFENAFGTLRHREFLLFIGPALALYALILLWPALRAFGWSLFRWDGINPREWAGLHHFLWLLLESEVFWTALGNNLFLMFVPGLVVIPMATAFAYWIHRGILGGAFFRVCFLFPNILGGVAATLLWMSAYEPAIGIVNAGLTGLGSLFQQIGLQGIGGWLLGFERFAWLSQERLYPSLIPILLWQGCGFNLILLLASMESIDPACYEAAEIEGASKGRQFFLVTLPMIWDAVLVVLIFWIIAGLNAFELVWLLTAQEPASGSHVLSTWMVHTLFSEYQVGRATAIAVMLFLLVFSGALLTWNLLRKEAVAT